MFHSNKKLSGINAFKNRRENLIKLSNKIFILRGSLFHLFYDNLRLLKQHKFKLNDLKDIDTNYSGSYDIKYFCKRESCIKFLVI